MQYVRDVRSFKNTADTDTRQLQLDTGTANTALYTAKPALATVVYMPIKKEK